jgi:hypothetical protein
MNHEIVVLGMSAAWSGPLAVDHAVMTDGIDIEPVRSALKRLGLDAAGQLAATERERVTAVLAKAEASHDGMLRGLRTVEINADDFRKYLSDKHGLWLCKRRSRRPAAKHARVSSHVAESAILGGLRTE